MFFLKKNKTTRENVRRRAHAQKVLWIKYVQLLSQHLYCSIIKNACPYAGTSLLFSVCFSARYRPQSPRTRPQHRDEACAQHRAHYPGLFLRLQLPTYAAGQCLWPVFVMVVLLPQIQQNHFRRILLGLFHGKMLINIIPLDNRADHLTHIVIAFIPIELHIVKPHHVRYEIHPA